MELTSKSKLTKREAIAYYTHKASHIQKSICDNQDHLADWLENSAAEARMGYDVTGRLSAIASMCAGIAADKATLEAVRETLTALNDID